MAESKTEKMQQMLADKAVDAEQLDNVSGGSYAYLCDDSEFLNMLLRGKPGQCKCNKHADFDDGFFATMRNRPIIDDIATAWAAVGIRLEGSADVDTANRYFNMETGAEMSRYDAIKHAENFFPSTEKHHRRRH
ncbi:hypothetical protein [Selenomonas sp. KH1T6]|uniref:hypothetical protein n=1 Tax=Selenomonas sp. KH1T6 TaxID=3158784 RepID=UPI0008A74DEA|nr:hypothetical protein SAMN05216583_12145 [Selenomonas ruminantium]